MERTKITTESECFMKYRDWNEMQRKLEALYVLDNALTDPSEEYLRLIRKTEDGEKGIDFFPLV